VTPALLPELRKVIPNLSSLAFFIEDGKRLVGGYTDNPEAARTSELYWSEFHGRRGRELGGAFPDNVHTQFGVLDNNDALARIAVDDQMFDRSDFYNLIFREQRIRGFMRLMVRDNGGRGRALGNVTVYRGPGEPPWSAEDKRHLAALQPFFAMVLKSESPDDLPLADSGRLGLVVADGAGRPLFVTPEARHLLNIAFYPSQNASTVFASSDKLPPALARLCVNLTRVFGADPDAEAPTHFMRNLWGGFTFRAQWLEGTDAAGLIGITITHKEPTAIRVARRVGELPLSRRQAEIAILLANGDSNETIAERLGISRHTAISHGRWIYNKLDVHNRTELVTKLLAH
jgi:DNA-binding CsgD family transcriptional regulator